MRRNLFAWGVAMVALGAACGGGGGGEADATAVTDTTSDTSAPDPQCVDQRNGTACDDGRPCTENDKCIEERCVGVTRKCDDADLCTDDSCDAATGACVHTPNTAPCSDSDQCTTQDRCAGGVCAGTPASMLACNDGDPCTVTDQCTAGVCDGVARDCDDGNPCTADSCDPSHPLAVAGTGCVNAPTTDPCDDGDQCTSDDTCGDGVCAGTIDEDASCDDGNRCTSGDRCNFEGACLGAPIVCDDGDVCTFDECDPAIGCRYPPNQGERCDDGSPCTLQDTCDADGACVGADKPCQPDDLCVIGTCREADGGCDEVAVDCDDGNPCTNDSCDPAVGCVHVDNTIACDDGSRCTTDDRCGGGVCAGTPKTCDPTVNNQCQENRCDPADGLCRVRQFDGSLCNDGQLCTNADTCIAGECKGVLVSCLDGDPCTDDYCESSTGQCVHTPLSPDACTSLALDRSNEYRELVDLPLLIDHEAIIAAAIAHCEYYVNNPGVYSGGFSAHNEQEGFDGFTGVGFGDRMRAAGYTGSPLFEVMAFIDHPVISVDEWMATLYHRIPFVVPNAYHMGYGAAAEGGRACDTIDFGSAPTTDPSWADLVIPFPPDGHTGVPTSWDGAENPQPPLPAPYPSGPILTLTIGAGNATLVSSDIHGPNGPVPHVANDESTDGDLCCGVMAFYPIAPIQTNANYTVSVTYRAGGGADKTFEWSFSTGDGSSSYFLQ